MPKLIITDSLGHTVVELDFAGYAPGELAAIARREAAAQAQGRGRVSWQIVDGRRRELAAGEATAPAREGLLPTGSPALYCERAAGSPGLAAFGTVAAVRGGHYLLEVDHMESDGRPVAFEAGLQMRIPVDTPHDGPHASLEAVPLAHQAAAE